MSDLSTRQQKNAQLVLVLMVALAVFALFVYL